MTKHTLSRVAAMFIAFVALFAHTGCKESSIINTNITPAGDSLIIEGEPVEITAKTVYNRFNTSLTFTGVAVVHGVGVISNDPEVGKTEAGIYFQVIPPQSAGYTLPGVIDSYVLVMPYIGFTYGDTSSSAVSNTYSAYYVTDDMAHGAVYYNDDHKNYEGTALGSATISYDAFNDSMSVEGKKAMPHLRIKLDDALISNKLTSANFASYLDFFASFKGLYVAASNNGNNNNIPYFRLTDDGAGTNWSKAGIVVYYHDVDSPTVVKSNLFGFNPDNCAHFNKVIQDAGGSKAANAVENENYLFFQSRPGLAVEISTKDVKLMENRIVNKAEIVITEVASDESDKYFAPLSLYPYLPSKTAAGMDTLLPVKDNTFTSTGGTQANGINFINGNAKKVTIGGQEYNQYTINVPREFQNALIEKREMVLRITGASNGYIGAYRLKAGKNASNPAFNIRMNVVYSSL